MNTTHVAITFEDCQHGHRNPSILRVALPGAMLFPQSSEYCTNNSATKCRILYSGSHLLYRAVHRRPKRMPPSRYSIACSSLSTTTPIFVNPPATKCSDVGRPAHKTHFSKLYFDAYAHRDIYPGQTFAKPKCSCRCVHFTDIPSRLHYIHRTTMTISAPTASWQSDNAYDMVNGQWSETVTLSARLVHVHPRQSRAPSVRPCLTIANDIKFVMHFFGRPYDKAVVRRNTKHHTRCPVECAVLPIKA
jgi:hypothetical protein